MATKLDQSNPAPADWITVEIPSNWKKDTLFFLVIGILIFLLMFWLSQGLYKNNRLTQGSVPIARLSFRENRVERKIGGDANWTAISASNPIYNYDSIRTEENSQARISLGDGAELVLSGAALITIVIDVKKLSLDLKEGNLSMISAPQNTAVNVRSSRGTLTIAGGGRASIRQTKEDSNKSLQVEVLEGNAVFADENGSVDLTQNQSLLQGEGGKTKVEEIPFQVLNPPQTSLQLIFDSISPIQFRWISNTFEASNIEISSTSDFSQDVRVFGLTQRNSFETELQQGAWYWRISNGRKKSPSAMFQLVQDRKPNPLEPIDESKFSFVNKPPLILFQWEKADNAMSYNVRIFDSNDLGSATHIIQNVTTLNSSISIDNLSEGSYLWEVEGVFPAFQTRVIGKRNKFQVYKLDQAEDIPELEIGLENTNISQYALKNNKAIVTWTWKKNPGKIQNYLIEILKNDTTVTSQTIDRTYLILPKDLSTGQYNFRVAALNDDGATVTSKIQNFVVESLGPLDWLSPTEDMRYPDTDQLISFRWRDANKGRSYLLEVADDSDFNDTILSQLTADSFLFVPNFGVGSYYSRVSLLDDKGSKLVSSKVQRFTIKRQLLPAPILEGPITSGVIDLTMYGSLSFRWSPVVQVDFYRLVIAPIGASKAVRTWDSDRPYKDEMDVLSLPLGQYRYSLTGFININGQDVPLSETNSGEFTLQRSLVGPVSGIQIF